jgi:hypothetical protein
MMMEPPILNVPGEIGFQMQCGLIRDGVTIEISELNLKTLKDTACNFIDRKVSTSGVSALLSARFVLSLCTVTLFIIERNMSFECRDINGVPLPAQRSRLFRPRPLFIGKRVGLWLLLTIFSLSLSRSITRCALLSNHLEMT